MPVSFAGKPCIYNLNGAGFTSELNCPEEFIFFHKNTATPVEVFDLTITFTTPFEYNYTSFTLPDIHGDLMDVKPFINIYRIGVGFIERITAGMGSVEGNRVLLVPQTWQIPDEGEPIWIYYENVTLDDCLPDFDNELGNWYIIVHAIAIVVRTVKVTVTFNYGYVITGNVMMLIFAKY